MFVEVAKKGDIAPGGMKGYTVAGRSIALCNDGGKYYAVSRRCGHMNGLLDKGVLVGYILTCPMHYAQFDVKSGHVLSGPVLHDSTRGYMLPKGPAALFRRVGGLMAGIRTRSVKRFFVKRMGWLAAHIKTCNIKTFKVRVEGESIEVDL